MPLDPAQRHQIEQDVLTAAWEAERLAACDDAIALPGEVVDLAADDDRGALLSRIVALPATHDQCQAIKTFLRLHPWARDLKY